MNLSHDFGLGEASACPENPPPPTGFHVWKGPVPEPLKAWAKAFLKNIAKEPLGTVYWSDPDIYPELVAARIDSHTWTYRNGKLVTGICIKGITLYRANKPGDLAPATGWVTDIETAKPDPTLAVYDPSPQQTDWGLVLATGAAVAGAVGLFWWGLQAAGKAAAA